jgi:UDP-N-acetylmuramoyl-L-alanyl-D-glutamate--2,6-diaminopimelate ligase
MRLSTLAAALPFSPLERWGADPEITQVTADSRQVQPGALFVAVSGESVDGQRFIPEAVARGAVAIAAEGDLRTLRGRLGTADERTLGLLAVPEGRTALGWLSAAWHGFPSRHLVLIGVTGTDGKTTTSNLIYAILQAAGLKAGMISTVNAVIGDEAVDTGFHVTTPDAPAVQSYLARMVAAGLTHCVLEVTSHGLAQQRVAGCEFDIAVITNITHEHLDYHKTFENYQAAKRRLFEMLSESSPKPAGAPVVKTAVLNWDDSSYPYLAAAVSGNQWAYSVEAPSGAAAGLAPDLWATGVTYSPASMQFTATARHFSFPITTPLVGSFNVSNCLAAVAATVGALGLSPTVAQTGLAAFAGVPGRMERLDLGQPFTALVDFAHTPNALKSALETVRQMTTQSPAGAGGRVIAVFGSAGLRDVEKRRLMAEVAAELADISILTAEDPRTESLELILETMAAGARARGAVELPPPPPQTTTGAKVFYRVPDRGEALRLAVRLAEPGDLVIACGKGHEQSMCFGTVEYPWDDRIALRAALAERLGRPDPAMPSLPTSRPAAKNG